MTKRRTSTPTQNTNGSYSTQSNHPQSTRLTKASFGPVKSNHSKYAEIGTTGLRQWSGSIHEERLRELRGREGRILYREMRDNDPVISAIFFISRIK